MILSVRIVALSVTGEKIKGDLNVDCHTETTVPMEQYSINQLNLYWFDFGQYGGW
jgi:hypothetical protein